jgi:N-acetylmuramoyl-L-alanine amidase
MRFWLSAVILLLVSGCATPPPVLDAQHVRLLAPSDLANSPRVKPLLIAPDDAHKIDWSKFKPTRAKPLAGIKIALDPGHMGGSPWDERGGKYLLNSQAQKLSEGTMALQLALLLERQFTKLGAEVFIDRRDLLPVTAHEYQDFDGIHNSAFFQRLDLDARAEKLWAFHPDLTLILHFDSHIDDNPPNPDLAKKLCNETKAYIPGEFTADDFNDEVDRTLFEVIWRNPRVWQDSLELSREITHQIHQQMGIPLASASDGHASLIEPGVLARNLRLQRRMAGFVSSYLESLCYEDLQEFHAFTQPEFSLKIQGQAHPYSRRLVQLSHAIRDGVVSFTNLKIPLAQ